MNSEALTSDQIDSILGPAPANHASSNVGNLGTSFWKGALSASSQLGLTLAHAAQAVKTGVVNAADQGAKTAEEGFTEAKSATDPKELIEGATQGARGTLDAVASPITGTVEAGAQAAVNKISDIPAVQKLAQSKFGTGTTSTATKAASALAALAKKYPDAAKDIGNIADIMGNLALPDAGGVAKDAAVDTAGKVADVAGKASDAVDAASSKVNQVVRNAADSKFQKATDLLKTPIKTPEKAQGEAWDMLKPSKLTPKVETEYKLQGKVGKSGLLTGAKIEPLESDKDMIDVTQPLFENGTLTKKMQPVEQLDVLEQEATKAHQDRASLTADHNAIFNDNQLKSYFDKAKDKSKLVFVGDETAEKAYNGVMDQFFTKLKTNTLSGLDDAITKFGKEADQKFKAFKFDANGQLHPTDNAKVTALRDIYGASRDFANDILPENSPYRPLLKKESGLLDARDRVIQNSIGQTDSKVVDWLKRHPRSERVIKYSAIAAGAAVLTGVAGKSVGDLLRAI